MYYTDKIESLKRIFGVEKLAVENGRIIINNDTILPVMNDVIIAMPDSIGSKAKKVQAGFGDEWKEFSDMLPEYKNEFRDYFDIVGLQKLKGKTVCDLGCGVGRWSYFMKDIAGEIVLVDFSDAIFEARENLKGNNNMIYIKADVRHLPFRDNFADFIMCLGVLHHLPEDALSVLRGLRKYAPISLIYLYYALDNRPVYFRGIFWLANVLRKCVYKIKSHRIKMALAFLFTAFIYKPLIMLGDIIHFFGLPVDDVPLYGAYKGKSFRRIMQDAYDRFFTSIEQRFSRRDILCLKDSYTDIIISDRQPYWHFLCVR